MITLPVIDPFYQRKLGVKVNVYDDTRQNIVHTEVFEGYRIRARVVSAVGPSSDAQIEIYGVNPTQITALAPTRFLQNNIMRRMDVLLYQITPDGSHVSVSAGQAIYSVPDFSGMPEVCLRLTVIPTQSLMLGTPQSVTVTGPVPLDVAVKAATPDFTGKLLVRPIVDVAGNVLPVRQVSTMAVHGSIYDRAEQLCRAAGYMPTYDAISDTLVLYPDAGLTPGAESSLPVKVLSQSRGMLGYPTPDAPYLRVTAIADINIVLSQGVWVDTRTAAFPGGFATIDGPWMIYAYSHSLTSDWPGGEFLTEYSLSYAGNPTVTQQAYNAGRVV